MKQACVALLIASIAIAPGSFAAPSPIVGSDDKALAETLFFAGRGLMEAGRLEEACAKFAESYRLDSAAGTLLNLAVCHQRTNKIASAWGEYRKAAADAKKAGRLDRLEFAESQVALLEPDLPYLKIEVPPAVKVKGLEILRNGRALADAAWDTELPIDPGVVDVVIRAPGYKERKATLMIERKEHRTIVIPALERLPVEPPKIKLVETGWSTTRSIGASVFLVGLASAGFGGYFAVRAADAKRESDDECPIYDGDRRCTAAGVNAMKTASTRAWLSTGGTVVAIAGLGLGAYLFVIGGHRNSEGPKSGALRLDVGASPSGVSGFLSGSF